MKAFIMIKLGTTEYMGLTQTVLEKLSELPGVASVHAIFGRYDVIAEVEVQSLGELSRMAQDKLKSISGVQSTETFICHE